MTSKSSSHSPYALNAAQLDDAVNALRTAAEALRPSPRQERLYGWLGISVKVTVAILVAAILCLMIVDLESRAYKILDDVFSYVLILSVAVATALLVINASVVRKSFRQRSVLKKLGIREVSRSAWKAERKRHTWRRIKGAVLTAAGVVILLMASLAWIGRESPDDVWAIVGVVLFVVLGSTILVWRFVQRSREQLAIVADANRLRSILQSMQTKASAGGSVEVPAALLEDVARIERVNIERQRSNAVVASAHTRSQGYALLVARSISEQKALLNPEQRVAVEDLMDMLSADPHSTGAEPIADGLLRVTTPDGELEIHYGIDEDAQRVRIVAVGRTGTFAPVHR